MRSRVLVLCFLKMPVNLARYRVTGGNFNYRQFIVSLHYEAPLYSGMSNSFSNQGSNNSSLIFYFFFYILFLSKGNFLKIITKFSVPFFLFHKIVTHVLVCLYSLLSMLSGDMENNSGPLNNCKEYFSIWHLNVNSISVHDYSKLFFFESIYYTS